MTLPRVQPITPTWRKEPFDDPEWVFDFKYDGFRALCYLEQSRCRFISRDGNVLSRFEALGDQLAAILQIDEAIIDGEVIAVDETGRPQFYDLLRRAQAPAYVAFDLLWVDGADLRSLSFSERRLRAVLPAAAGIVFRGAFRYGRGCELFELICANDLEGIVAKRLADRYDTRTRWLKIKNPDYSQKEGRQGGSVQRATAAPSASGRVAVNSYMRPPMTLGNAVSARVRLIVWCKACGHQVEPGSANLRAPREI
jgi:bifunctional non-homologous end joining protein LigD